jgi:hypothetical protein
MRLAITRVEEGEREVPVAMSVSGVVEEGVRLKKIAGTDPHVNGAMKVAIAERPG